MTSFPRFMSIICTVLLFPIASPAPAQSDDQGGAQPSQSDKAHVATFWRKGDPGDRLMLSGRVLDAGGKPLAGAVMDVWQTDGTGSYRSDAYRGTLVTDDAGRYALRTVVPVSYGGVKHIHMIVGHSGHQPASARVLFKGDPALRGYDSPNAIVLEETRVDDEVVFVGTFDVVLPGQ